MRSGDWIPDPRLEALGQRMVLPARDKATSPAGEPETEGFEFRAWRIEHGIAEGDTEMTAGEEAWISCRACCCLHAAPLLLLGL